MKRAWSSHMIQPMRNDLSSSSLLIGLNLKPTSCSKTTGLWKLLQGKELYGCLLSIDLGSMGILLVQLTIALLHGGLDLAMCTSWKLIRIARWTASQSSVRPNIMSRARNSR